MFKFPRKKRYTDIEPDEIFLDAHNMSGLDVDQFEGRLERPIRDNTTLTLAFVFICIGLVFIGKLFALQVVEGDELFLLSENNRLDHVLLFAKRGVIVDRNGIELAVNTVLEDSSDFPRRTYAEVRGVGHILGYVDYPKKDNAGFYFQEEVIGQDGVELHYDELLSGENGAKIAEEDALGEVLSESLTRLPKDGENLILSIDSRIQEQMYLFMEDLALDVGFTGGGGVIIDVHTGEVLAMTSYPEPFPQALTDRDDEEYITNVFSDVRKPFLNRVTTGLYAPGSVIKPILAVGALDRGVITPEKAIFSSGQIEVPNPYDPSQSTIFKDWKAHGWVDMREALAVSSNVYFFSIGGGYEDQSGIGISGIEKYARAFGLGETTNVDLPTEAGGNIPNQKWKEKAFPEDPTWRLGDTYNTSIGQYGFLVTPLQMARAVAAIANDGLLVTPHVRLNTESAPTGVVRGVDTDDLEVVREGMRQAVLSGTAKGLSAEYVAIAAKTGTAELGVEKDDVNSWVVGFFPYEEPRYAFATVMERGPAINLIGSLFVMRQVFDWMRYETPEYFE